MDINHLIYEWNFRVRQIKDIDKAETVSYGNVNLAIDRFLALSIFLRSYLPFMREWMMTYLETNRAAIFTRWWREHINKWAVNHIDRFTYITLHPDATQWDTAFPETKSVADANSILKEITGIRDISKCDIPKIATMHDGKEHNGDWYGCDLCDTQEYLWKNELCNRIKTADHPLLNMTLPLPESVVPSTWEPPHTWSYEQSQWLTIEAYKEVMQKVRDTVHPKTQSVNRPMYIGKTPIQIIRIVMPLMLQYGGWKLNEINYVSKDSYILFIQLWNVLDLVSYTTFLDLPTLINLHVDYK